MAHKIDNSKGFNSFVGYKESAWHGLGTILDARMDIKQALKLSGMDYEVKKAPNVHVFQPTHSLNLSHFAFRLKSHFLRIVPTLIKFSVQV